MPKCQIQWVDKNGQPTPDDNPAMQRVRCRGRIEQHHGRAIHFPGSNWFYICSEHSKRLNEPGMHYWECSPLD